MRTIVVCGATGATGFPTAKALSRRANSFNIKAIVNLETADKNKLNQLQKLPGVDVVNGDIGDKSFLSKTLKGVWRAFLVCSISDKQVELEKNFIDACKENNVDLLVKMSTCSPNGFVAEDSPVDFGRHHYQVERYLADSGLRHVIIRPNWYLDNLLWSAEEIKRQKLVTIPFPGIPARMVALDDVGEVAATLLTRDDVSLVENKVVNVNGKEEATVEEMTKTLSRLLGEEIRVVDISPKDLKHEFVYAVGAGTAKDLQKTYSDFWSSGAFNIPHSPELESLSCSPQITQSKWIEQNIEAFRLSDLSGKVNEGGERERGK